MAITQWEIPTLPGVRIMNWHGGGAVIQFEKGKEEETLNQLAKWIEGKRIELFHQSIEAEGTDSLSAAPSPGTSASNDDPKV